MQQRNTTTKQNFDYRYNQDNQCIVKINVCSFVINFFKHYRDSGYSLVPFLLKEDSIIERATSITGAKSQAFAHGWAKVSRVDSQAVKRTKRRDEIQKKQDHLIWTFISQPLCARRANTMGNPVKMVKLRKSRGFDFPTETFRPSGCDLPLTRPNGWNWTSCAGGEKNRKNACQCEISTGLTSFNESVHFQQDNQQLQTERWINFSKKPMRFSPKFGPSCSVSNFFINYSQRRTKIAEMFRYF